MYTLKNLEMFNTNCYEWFSHLQVNEDDREIVIEEYKNFFNKLELEIITNLDESNASN